MIQDFCRLFSIRGYYKTMGVIPLMLCTTEPHRLEVGPCIFLGLRTWFPERGSSPRKGGRTARHTWRSVSLQPQAIGRWLPEAPRRPQDRPPAPFPLGCGSIAGLGHLCVASKLNAGPGCPRRPPSSWVCSSGWGWGRRRGGWRLGKEEGKGHPRGSGRHHQGDNPCHLSL